MEPSVSVLVNPPPFYDPAAIARPRELRSLLWPRQRRDAKLKQRALDGEKSRSLKVVNHECHSPQENGRNGLAAWQGGVGEGKSRERGGKRESSGEAPQAGRIERGSEPGESGKWR